MFLIALGFTKVVTATPEHVSLGYFVMKPYIYFDENPTAPSGIVPDFLNGHIAPKMNVNFRYVHLSIARILAEMKKGKLDGIAILGYNPERALEHDYPGNHMQEVEPILAILSDSKLTYDTLLSEKGPFKIGHVKDSIVTPSMLKLMDQFEIMHGDDVWKRSTEKLLLRRIDTLYAPFEAPLKAILKELNAERSVKVITLKQDAFKLYTIFSKHENVRKRNLVHRYERAFTAADGKSAYRQVYEKHIKN